MLYTWDLVPPLRLWHPTAPDHPDPCRCRRPTVSVHPGRRRQRSSPHARNARAGEEWPTTGMSSQSRNDGKQRRAQKRLAARKDPRHRYVPFYTCALLIFPVCHHHRPSPHLKAGSTKAGIRLRQNKTISATRLPREYKPRCSIIATMTSERTKAASSLLRHVSTQYSRLPGDLRRPERAQLPQAVCHDGRTTRTRTGFVRARPTPRPRPARPSSRHAKYAATLQLTGKF